MEVMAEKARGHARRRLFFPPDQRWADGSPRAAKGALLSTRASAVVLGQQKLGTLVESFSVSYSREIFDTRPVSRGERLAWRRCSRGFRRAAVALRTRDQRSLERERSPVANESEG